MNFDVADLIRRAGKTRLKRVVLLPITPTAAQQGDLRRIYARIVRAWSAAWRERVEPVYSRTVAEGIRDSVEDTEQALDYAAAAALSRLFVELDAALEDWVVRIEEWHRGRFAQLFTPAGVNLATLLGRGNVQVTLEAVLAENVSLIRSLNDQMRNGISGAVFRGLTNRSPARDVAREIRKLTGIGTRRAELIAADQLQKLTARLDQERQQQVGVRKFQWAHSRKRYPRPEHVARDGKVFAWSSKVGRTDPPGRAIRCGCRARPVVELDSD